MGNCEGGLEAVLTELVVSGSKDCGVIYEHVDGFRVLEDLSCGQADRLERCQVHDDGAHIDPCVCAADIARNGLHGLPGAGHEDDSARPIRGDGHGEFGPYSERGDARHDHYKGRQNNLSEL